MASQPKPARPGSLKPLVGEEAKLLRAIARQREAVWRRAWGQHSRLKVDILRLCVVLFSEGRYGHINDYVSECGYIASPSSIRAMLEELARRGAVLLENDPDDRRAQRVVPTSKLIAFFNEDVRFLVERAASIVSYGDLL